jgi:ABC-type bacteriocin/lantibiotic exporter with double-glycine peptidase domain
MLADRPGAPGVRRGDVVLVLPDVRQAAGHDCGAAVLECVLRFYGVAPARWVRALPNPVQGVSPDTIEAVLWATLGRVCRGTMTTADLRHHTRAGRPVLCPVADHGGHWVCVAGVERGRVHYHDPLTGPAVAGAADWDRRWADSTPGVPYTRFGLTGWPA